MRSPLLLLLGVWRSARVPEAEIRFLVVPIRRVVAAAAGAAAAAGVAAAVAAVGAAAPVLLPARCSSRLFLDVEGYSVKELWMVDNQIAVADFIATLGRLASVDADIDAHFDEDIGVVSNGCKIAALEEASNQSTKTMPGGPPGPRSKLTYAPDGG